MHGAHKGLQFHDLLFFLLMSLSFYFTRNTFCNLLMVLFFGYTVYRLIGERRRIVMPFYCVGIAIFILYGFVNVWIDNVINKSVAQTMAISLTLNLLMLFMTVQYVLMQKDVKKILHILERSILVVTVTVLVLSAKTITQGRLATGTQINANTLSMLCVYGFILTLYLRKIKKISRLSWLLREAIYLASVLLTGSRKGLIMIVLAFMVISLTGGMKKIVRTAFIGMITAALLFVLVMNVPFLYDIIGVRVENLINLLTNGTTTDSSLNSRQELIGIGIRYIKKQPWFGYGLDCFKMISGRGSGGNVAAGTEGYYSHNNYIELLFGAGIVGTALYYIPILHLLKKLIGAVKNNPCIAYLLAIFVSRLAVEFAYVSYYSRPDTYILAVILGCALLAKNSSESRSV